MLVSRKVLFDTVCSRGEQGHGLHLRLCLDSEVIVEKLCI